MSPQDTSAHDAEHSTSTVTSGPRKSTETHFILSFTLALVYMSSFVRDSTHGRPSCRCVLSCSMSPHISNLNSCSVLSPVRPARCPACLSKVYRSRSSICQRQHAINGHRSLGRRVAARALSPKPAMGRKSCPKPWTSNGADNCLLQGPSFADNCLKQSLPAAHHCTDRRSHGCCCLPAGAASQPARQLLVRLLRVPACKAAHRRSSAHRHQCRRPPQGVGHRSTCAYAMRQANTRCCTAACCHDAAQRWLSRNEKGRRTTQCGAQAAKLANGAANFACSTQACCVQPMSTYIVKFCQGWSKRCNRRKELGQSKVAHRQPLERLQAPAGPPGNCGAATLLPCACCSTCCAAGSGDSRLGRVCAMCLPACSGCGVFNRAKLEAVY